MKYTLLITTIMLSFAGHAASNMTESDAKKILAERAALIKKTPVCTTDGIGAPIEDVYLNKNPNNYKAKDYYSFANNAAYCSLDQGLEIPLASQVTALYLLGGLSVENKKNIGHSEYKKIKAKAIELVSYSYSHATTDANQKASLFVIDKLLKLK